MTEKELIAMWRFEEEFPFTGWDFSHLDERWEEEELPWSYRKTIKRFLAHDHNILDIETGGGEFLLSLRHPYELTSVTEAYPPNVALCMNELAPLGITVREYTAQNEPLPFGDERFDAVLCRHGAYDADELYRVLKPGGVFITEQVGARNNMQLSRRLLTDYFPANPLHDLAHECARFDAANFELVERREYFPKLRFYDVGALVYYARVIEWEFPDFSVERCMRELLSLEREIQERGMVESLQHLFLIVARKPL